MKTPVLKILVASLAVAAGAALAQGYGPGYGRGMGPGMGWNWQTMNELRTEQWKLRDLYAAKADAATIAEQQKKVDALREQMFQQRAAMHRQMDAAPPR